MPQYSTNIDTQIINLIRTFVDDKVLPIADKYDSEDIYPFELVDDMANLGLFGMYKTFQLRPKRMVKSTLLMVPKCSYLMDKMVTHLQF